MRPASFPTNGRTLTDDTADAFLVVLTNGKVTGDRVGLQAAAGVCGNARYGSKSDFSSKAPDA